MNFTQKVCIAVFLVNVVTRNGLYVILYIYGSLNYMIVPFLILSDTVSYATATLFLLSKAASNNNNYTVIHQLKHVVNKIKEISQKYAQPDIHIAQHKEDLKHAKLEEEKQFNYWEAVSGESQHTENADNINSHGESSPLKKTTIPVGIRRDGCSDRKVNDFIRSILIEDDNQYDLLNTTPDKLGNTYKDAFTYDYPRLTYDPRQHKEMVMNNQKFY